MDADPCALKHIQSPVCTSSPLFSGPTSGRRKASGNSLFAHLEQVAERMKEARERAEADGQKPFHVQEKLGPHCLVAAVLDPDAIAGGRARNFDYAVAWGSRAQPLGLKVLQLDDCVLTGNVHNLAESLDRREGATAVEIGGNTQRCSARLGGPTLPQPHRTHLLGSQY